MCKRILLAQIFLSLSHACKTFQYAPPERRKVGAEGFVQIDTRDTLTTHYMPRLWDQIYRVPHRRWCEFLEAIETLKCSTFNSVPSDVRRETKRHRRRWRDRRRGRSKRPAPLFSVDDVDAAYRFCGKEIANKKALAFASNEEALRQSIRRTKN